MKIELWAIGKLKNRDIAGSLDKYQKRIRKFHPLHIEEIPIRERSTDPEFLKQTEGDKVLEKLSSNDYLILMDENGKMFTSTELAGFLQNLLMQPIGRIVFLIGGAHGFSSALYERSQYKLSLSRLTFPHDLARLLTAEQLYRSFSILNHSPYHH